MILLIILMLLVIACLGGAAYYLSRRHRDAADNRMRRNRKAKVKQTNQSQRLNLRYADDRIFISGNGVYTGIKLPGTTDEYLTDRESEEAATRIARAYNDLIAVFDGNTVECQELLRFRPASTEQWAADYITHQWNPTRLFKQLLRQVRRHLAGASPERQRFLIVRLGDFTAKTFPDPLSVVAEKISGVTDEHFSQRDLEPFHRQAVKVQLQLASHSATPMTKGDLVWLCRKAVSGHRQPSEVPVLASRLADGGTDSRALRGSHFDMLFDFHGTNGLDYIEIHDHDPETGERRTSYTTTLVVANSPQYLEYNPASAWGPRLATLSRPVEINWRYELIPAEDFKRRIKKVIKNLRDEEKDRDRGGADHDYGFEGKLERAQELEKEVQTQGTQPGMIGRLRLVLSAPTPQELADAEVEVRAAMGEIEMVRVPRLQYHLLMEQLPGEYNGRIIGSLQAARAGRSATGVSIGTRTTDLWAGAIARLDSDDRVGDEQDFHKGQPRGWRGFPIGYNNRNGNPVHLQLHVQVARDRGAGVGLIGGTGGGKTTTALLLFFWESESGTQCVVADPKNEFERFCYYLAFGSQCLEPEFRADADRNILGTSKSRFQPVNREFWNNTTIVNLTRGTAGLLDPWAVRRAYQAFDADQNRVQDPYFAAESLARGQLELMFGSSSGAKNDAMELCEEALREMRSDWEALQRYKEDPQNAPFAQDFRPSLGRLEIYLEKIVEHRQRIDENAKTPESDRYLNHSRRVLDAFKNARNVKYARLMFGQGNEETTFLSGLDKRRVVFTMHGFVPPADPDNIENWSSDERNAAAVMYTVLEVMQGLFDSTERRHPVTGQYRTPPRALFIDEGYMITAIRAGRMLILRALRQGRSLNLVVVFISQQPGDITKIEQDAKNAKAETNQFGTVIVFKQKSTGEARQALALLRDDSATENESEGELVELARNLLEEGPAGGLLRTGRCVMRDASGRVATIDVDQMFWELANATETNPDKRSDAQEQSLSADGRDWHIDDRTLLDVRTAVIDDYIDPLDIADEDIDYPEDLSSFLNDDLETV